MEITQSKRCTKCLKMKDRSSFYLRNKKRKHIQAKCIICSQEESKEYKKNNRDLINKTNSVWVSKNKEKVKLSKKKEYKNNKEKYLVRNAKWYMNNNAKMAAWNKQYQQEQYRSNIEYRLRSTLRARLNQIVRHNYKKGSAVRDLGCTVQEFKKYLENNFEEGMSWEKWGRTGWHIDHIIPLSSFDLTDEKQIKKACHYTNLQPLWHRQNLIKGNRIFV